MLNLSNRNVPVLSLVAVLALISVAATAQSSPPRHQQDHSMQSDTHEHAGKNHYQDVEKHGDMAMGFSHLKSTHHFRLTSSGGFIQVGANDPGDAAARAQIQTHLRHISKAFKAGDFSAPEFTHGRIPPGVPAMQRLKSRISYTYAGTKTGGRVLIRTASPAALQAIHEFLRFQIEDHRTGDPTTLQK
jgi:hypothetical protein